MNDKVGVAPAYESIIEHEKTLVNIVPATKTKVADEKQAPKKRISRCRRKWCGKLGRVNIQGGGNMEYILDKATISFR